MKANQLQPSSLAITEPQFIKACHRRPILLKTCSFAWALAHVLSQQRAEGATADHQAKPALYDSFAKGYDTLDDGAAASLFGFPELRQRMLSLARGRVLECGAGTGVNSSTFWPVTCWMTPFCAPKFPKTNEHNTVLS
jgi:hypothetical protein